MDALRTYLTWRTSRSAKRTARNTAAVARATREHTELAVTQDLVARGWIGPAAMPGQRRAALATLDAQAIERAAIVDEAAGQRVSRYWIPAAVAIVGTVFAGLLTYAAATVGGPLLAVVATWVMVVLFTAAAVAVVRHRETHRAAVLSHAVERDGHCMWCGAPAPHRLEGVPTEPRVYHAVEVRQALRQ